MNFWTLIKIKKTEIRQCMGGIAENCICSFRSVSPPTDKCIGSCVTNQGSAMKQGCATNLGGEINSRETINAFA